MGLINLIILLRYCNITTIVKSKQTEVFMMKDYKITVKGKNNSIERDQENDF